MVLPRITTDDVREILGERRVFATLPGDLTDDRELALDSMGIIWLLHVLEERFGILVEPTDADLAEFSSLNRIVTYVTAHGRPASTPEVSSSREMP